MHKKLRLYPNNETLKVTYRRYRNFCNGLLKKLKIQYELNQIITCKNNSKKPWTAIKSLTYLQKQKEYPHDLLKAGDLPQSSTNTANQFFASVGN